MSLESVDSQKWLTSTTSPLLHTNTSHFLILLILIFWPIYWSFHLISTYADSFQIISKSPEITRNQFKTIANWPQMVSNQPSHIAIYQTSSINHLPINFRHCCVFQCLIMTSKLSNLTFSVIMSFDTRSTYQFNIWSLTLLNPSVSDHNISRSP